MVGVEPLKLVENGEQAQRLLQALARDLPYSIHVTNIVENLLEYNAAGHLDGAPELRRAAVYRYAEDGDASDGDATVVTVCKVGPQYVTVCLHSTDTTNAALRRVLADSAVLPWGEDIHFDSVHERCVPVLLEEVRARADPASPPRLFLTDKMYLPKEEAVNMDVSCPPGYALLPLEVKHAVAVASAWGSNIWPGALDMVKSILMRHPGTVWGVFPADQTGGQPAARPAAQVAGEGGFLRMLFTAEEHRRKGLGGLVTRAACKVLAARGKDLHCNIDRPNPASMATFTKLGFRRLCEYTYVVYFAPRQPRATP
ncbi:uncharacterized protein LOC117647316 [Thrips palmi]|uniref:Uncharacterized protein LOC117647316 n=1 Tax=Thrips palmi TaxID=161013 RepID=A0A6P8YXQ9_THRPL|nr:uncharacterized protein LOC117647316 [Thrips palmi]